MIIVFINLNEIPTLLNTIYIFNPDEKSKTLT